MKLIIFTILLSVSAFAAKSASMDYQCEMMGSSTQGTVKIDNRYLKGQPSCMFFEKKTVLCFRFERMQTVDDIVLTLKDFRDLSTPTIEDYIMLSGMPFSEGGIMEQTIKVGIFKKRKLNCSFTNVNW